MPPIPEAGIVRIHMSAGFGPDWSDLPADLSLAILMLAAHFYEFRHDAGTGAKPMPFGVSSLIERFRNVRLFGGVRS